MVIESSGVEKKKGIKIESNYRTSDKIRVGRVDLRRALEMVVVAFVFASGGEVKLTASNQVGREYKKKKREYQKIRRRRKKEEKAEKEKRREREE